MTKTGESGSSRRKKLYELVEERRPRLRKGLDVLDEVLLSEERELAQEHKRLRLEQLIDKRRREVEKMRNGVVAGGPMASNSDFMRMAKMMSDLTPEEQQRVANAYSVLRMADRGQVGGSLGLLGPLIGYARQNPGSSEEQMLKYLALMDNQLLKGIELSKAVNPGPGEDQTLKFMQLMKDLVIAGVRDPVLQALEKAQPQPGLLDSIFMRPEVYNRMRETGLFGGNSAAKGTVDIELEKLRGERHLQIKKWDLEMHRDELKRLAEDRRTETLLSVFAPLAAAFAGPVSQKMQVLGQQQAAAHNPIPANPTPTAPPGDYVQLQCPCGYRGTKPLTSPPQTEIICPRCNQVLTFEPPSTKEKTVDTSIIHSTEETKDEW